MAQVGCDAGGARAATCARRTATLSGLARPTSQVELDARQVSGRAQHQVEQALVNVLSQLGSAAQQDAAWLERGQGRKHGQWFGRARSQNVGLRT